jgi:hypothetical protein
MKINILIAVILCFVLTVAGFSFSEGFWGIKEPYKTPQEKENYFLRKLIEENTNQKNEILLENEKLSERIQQLIRETKEANNKHDVIIGVINDNVKGKLANKGEVFYITGKMYKVNPLLMVAIAIHETANGTSKMINTQNNVGGFYYNGKFLNFRSIDESIFYMARLLKNEYIQKGLVNIELIGSKYCPVGASNDPAGLNENWVPRVTEIYLDLLSKTWGAI